MIAFVALVLVFVLLPIDAADAVIALLLVMLPALVATTLPAALRMAGKGVAAKQVEARLAASTGVSCGRLWLRFTWFHSCGIVGHGLPYLVVQWGPGAGYRGGRTYYWRAFFLRPNGLHMTRRRGLAFPIYAAGQGIDGHSSIYARLCNALHVPAAVAYGLPRR